MPLKQLNDPLRLEDQCIVVYVNHLVDELRVCGFLERFENSSTLLRRYQIKGGDCRKQIQVELDVLPGLMNDIARQKMFDIILCKIEFIRKERSLPSDLEAAFYSALDVVAQGGIKYFDLKQSGANIEEWAEWMKTVLVNCPSLERLVLPKPASSVANDASNLNLALQCHLTINHHLKELVIGECNLDFQTFSAIGRFCPNLVLLDISKVDFSDEELLSLCKCDTLNEKLNPVCHRLEILKMKRFSLSDVGQTFLVQHVQNLKSMGEQCLSLTPLKTFKDQNPKRTTKLTEVSFSIKDPQEIEVLAAICPNVEILHLQYAGPDNCEGLKLFSRLRNLVVENFSCVEGILPFIGKQLTALSLNGHILEYVDIDIIASNCLHLESLDLRKCKEIVHYHFFSVGPCIPFQELRVLLLCEVNLSTAIFILGNAHKLKQLFVANINGFTDGKLEELLLRNPLVNLEEFNIQTSNELTMDSVNTLLEKCPKLRRLGSLLQWQQVKLCKLRQLRKKIGREKLDLELLGPNIKPITGDTAPMASVVNWLVPNDDQGSDQEYVVDEEEMDSDDDDDDFDDDDDDDNDDQLDPPDVPLLFFDGFQDEGDDEDEGDDDENVISSDSDGEGMEEEDDNEWRANGDDDEF